MSRNFPDSTPTFKEALRADRIEYEDCTACRALGSAAFLGLGAYTYISGHSNLKKQEKKIRMSGTRFGVAQRRVGITSLAGMLVGVGVYRWFN